MPYHYSLCAPDPMGRCHILRMAYRIDTVYIYYLEVDRVLVYFYVYGLECVVLDQSSQRQSFSISRAYLR